MSALVVSDVSRNFGGVQALSNVSFEVAPGERRLIIGPNGAGKTTLFNLLSGVLAVSDGKVMLFDRDITNLPLYERAHMGLARTFQITNLFPAFLFWKTLCWPCRPPTRARFPCLRGCGPTARCFTMPSNCCKNGVWQPLPDEPQGKSPTANNVRST